MQEFTSHDLMRELSFYNLVPNLPIRIIVNTEGMKDRHESARIDVMGIDYVTVDSDAGKMFARNYNKKELKEVWEDAYDSGRTTALFEDWLGNFLWEEVLLIVIEGCDYL